MCAIIIIIIIVIFRDHRHQVCDEQKCEEQTFPLAVNFFDRFLCALAIDRYHLQLLGCCTLLLASKIRQCQPLTVDVLSAYTDHAVSPDQIRVSVVCGFVTAHVFFCCCNCMFYLHTHTQTHTPQEWWSVREWSKFLALHHQTVVILSHKMYFVTLSTRVRICILMARGGGGSEGMISRKTNPLIGGQGGGWARSRT